jgi:Tfp pilus assembly protein PilF
LLRAYEQEKVGNYEDAEGKFEHAAKFGRPSATYWFNYAAFLFKYRGELDKN